MEEENQDGANTEQGQEREPYFNEEESERFHHEALETLKLTNVGVRI